jgi:hypothetical protein
MARKVNPRTFIFILLLVALGITAFGINLYKKYPKHVFRLSSTEVYYSLTKTEPQCKKISDCKLLPGDILIRRYITKRTWFFDMLFNPYFTHSAFYIGDDQIVEATGTERNSEDDIKINQLSKSFWFNNDVNNFVVIRPKNYNSKLDTIKNNLKGIANDPEYTFGLSKGNDKKTTCADLIFKQLIDGQLIQISNKPKEITPDYLFWVMKNNPNDFEIFGYNIKR